MAPNDPSDPCIRMMPVRLRCLPLPYVPELFADELLSSWLRRTGMEYGISLEQLARHIGLSRIRPADIDHDLSPDEIGRLAGALRAERTEILRRLHHPLRPPVCSLRASCPGCPAHLYIDLTGARDDPDSSLLLPRGPCRRAGPHGRRRTGARSFLG